MATPDASLGIPVTFDSASVRNALLFAMQMGQPDRLPADQTQRVTFIRRTGTSSYQDVNGNVLDPTTVRRDRDGKPLDPMIRMVVDPDEKVPVDCAIEIHDVLPEQVPVGSFKPVRATVTLMEQEYQQVVGCREMTYNNDRYRFSYEPEADGLFDMTFHVLIFYAIDES